MHSAEWSGFCKFVSRRAKKQMTIRFHYGIMAVHRKTIHPFADLIADNNRIYYTLCVFFDKNAEPFDGGAMRFLKGGRCFFLPKAVFQQMTNKGESDYEEFQSHVCRRPSEEYATER